MKYLSHIVLFTFAAGLALSSSAARVPYANDFSTRTSGASPSDRWMEMPYETGLLARPWSSYTPRMPYYQGDKIQDGWAMKKGYHTDKATLTVVNDGGNQGAVVQTSQAVDTFAVVHPFNNEFTNGILRLSVDIRTPDGGFANNGSPRAVFAPLFRVGMDVSLESLYSWTSVGPAYMSDSTSQQLRAILAANNGSGSTTYIGRTLADNAITAGNWYRYVVTINLNDRTHSATYADLGTAHPTWATSGATPKDFFGWINSVKTTVFSPVNTMTDATGGIAGLALYLTNINMPSSAPEKSAVYDNILVEWKATADAEFASVYENDFTTRRYRSLGGTTSGSYELTVRSYAVESSSYGRASFTNDYGVSENSCQRLVPDAVGPSGAVEPVGVDGWRRFDGREMMFSLIDPNKTGGVTPGYGWKNGAVLRPTISANNKTRAYAHGHLVHPIGTELTSGKVRLYFDLLPSKWYAASDTAGTWAGVFLGSAIDAPYQTSANDVKVIMTNLWTCGGGFVTSASANGNTTSSKWMGSSSVDPKASVTGIISGTTTNTPTCAYWYRFKLTADLDAKTYDLEAYRAGTVGPAMTDSSFMTDANKKLSVTGRSFCRTAPAKIDSIILSVWNAAKYGEKTKPSATSYMIGAYPLIDSIRVCRVNADGSDGTELYANDFETCTRNVTVDSATVGEATDRPGADGWTARGVMQSAAYVTGENPAVVLNNPGDYSKRLLHPIGVVSKGAAEMTVCADVRPPMMAVASNAYVWVELGGDDYWQGNLSSAHAFTDAPRIAFGFAQHKAQVKKSYGYTNLTFAVKSANGVATVVDDTFLNLKKSSHNWYRFRATVDSAAHTFTVRVYDQGAGQPTAASADGTLVATFADQPLPAFAGKGITTVGLADYGIAGSIGTEVDPNVALVDNLSVDSVPYGMTLFVR